MYKNFTFSQWLTRYKSFNSMSHFKSYINNISALTGEREYAYQYYKNQYETWVLNNQN